MEAIHANGTSGNIGVELTWKMDEAGCFVGNIDDLQFAKCLSVLAESAGLQIKLKASDAEKDIGTDLSEDSNSMHITDSNMKLFAHAIGEALGAALEEQCKYLQGYSGIGSADVEENNNHVYCNLTLPGRNAWVYELVTKDSSQSDGIVIDEMFAKLAAVSKIKLVFRVNKYDLRSAELMALTFGRALRIATQKE